MAVPGLRPLAILDLPVVDLYGDHWSLGGGDVPDSESGDDAVFLPGRNVLLLSKAMLWCHLHGVPGLALGTLGGNPFADATDGDERCKLLGKATILHLRSRERQDAISP